MQILSNPISTLNVRISPKFSMATSNIHQKCKYGRFAHVKWKICNITLIYGRIGEIFASWRKSESRNTMSDLRVQVEIWLFCACAMHPAIIIGRVRSL